jgi:succinate dehydrogenase / fumarate reductase, flavoprotein subunit
LLEASLFGRRAGMAIADFVHGGAVLVPISGDPAGRSQNRIKRLLDNQGHESVEAIAEELKQTMTDNCGVFRDQERMDMAMTKIKELQGRFQNARTMDKSSRFNTDLLTTIETEHLLNFSEVIVAGALVRTESRGAHSRTDFPKRDDQEWLKHTLAHKQDGEGPALSYKAVNIDWDRYPPQERKY